MITYNFIKYLILYIRYCRVLNKSYQEEDLISGLSRMFGVEVKQDWIGRLYCVINPNIVDGKYDPNSRIFDHTDTGMTTDTYVEQYIMKILNAVNIYVKSNNLFDLVTYDIQRLDDYDNYLFIIKPVPHDDLKRYTKYFLILLISILVMLMICLIIF